MRYDEEKKARIKECLVGHDDKIDEILPYAEAAACRLNDERRPVGSFLLLGPSGCGKTRTVEALAYGLHGDARRLLRIDCGEFMLPHETARLIGAPPGYLGHRETHPLLTQTKINNATSERSNLSILLFDEVEKAHKSFFDILLGILDHGKLRLGDSSVTDFSRTLIFMTSNLGSRTEGASECYGMPGSGRVESSSEARNARALVAAKKFFRPEFMGRVNEVLFYEPLSRESLRMIFHLEMLAWHERARTSLGIFKAFNVRVEYEAAELLLDEHTGRDIGARDLRNAMRKKIFQPVTRKFLNGEIEPGSTTWIIRDDVVKKRALATG